MIDRSRPGCRAMAASIDLCARSDDLEKKLWEAHARIEDLYYNFAEALLLFPGGSDYRACFFGETVWVVREVRPNEKLRELWPRFCGHVYALCAQQQKSKAITGDLGIRVIASYGQLLQIRRSDSWKDALFAEETSNWFVLTGANESVAKCIKAERSGRENSFLDKYFWHESLDRPCHYLGTPIASLPSTERPEPELYSEFYRRMCLDKELTAQLAFEPWPSQTCPTF
jgi:hypothetical protein